MPANTPSLAGELAVARFTCSFAKTSPLSDLILSLGASLLQYGHLCNENYFIADILSEKDAFANLDSVGVANDTVGLEMSSAAKVAAFDVLTATACELQRLLSAGDVTSVHLVESYLAQIERHNHTGMNLRAVLAVAPRDQLLQRAAELDKERASGHLRGPLHGVPILVKDCFATDPTLGMDTTAGSFALVGSKPRRSAIIIERLVRRGLIILGKANLTEFSNCKGTNITSGWSPVGGQTQSPYIAGGVKKGEERMGYSAPGGSSSGSAVGVAAGFAPLSIGTENDGSVTSPASRAALYAIKGTTKAIPMDGVLAITHTFDTVGAMAKSPEDLAHLFSALRAPLPDESTITSTEAVDYSKSLKRSWEGIRIGFLDPRIWKLPTWLVSPDDEVVKQTVSDYEKMLAKIEDLGAKVRYPVEFILRDELKLNDEDILGLLLIHEAKSQFASYLEDLKESKVRSVEDIIQFNKDHAELELPPSFPKQLQLEKVMNDNTTKETAETARQILHDKARIGGFDAVFERFGLDAIAGPTDSMLSSMAAAAGYPIITIPMGVQKTNGRPFGLGVVTRANDEQTLFHIMSAHEATFPPRVVPPLSVHRSRF